MKRLMIFLVLAGVFFMAGNGFVAVDVSPVVIAGCDLRVDKLLVVLEPGNLELFKPVSINAEISNGEKNVALGFARVETLKIPENGMTFELPLSQELAHNRNYQVKISVGNKSEGAQKTFFGLSASGSSSNSFFNRNFNPLPELVEIRNAIKPEPARNQMRIN